ncbi:MAG: hypothetical protein ISF22_06070 [Methanomassiliicoccus sp.]|nr:hypothetical protein [Methanomassiliicoccus sp.]
MVRVFGFGEDALTYHVLAHRLEELLDHLGDASDPSSCVLLFRPSLGSGGRGRYHPGECDAALITPRFTYLIESRWGGSKELDEDELAPSQERRHRMIEWVAERWNGEQSSYDFYQDHNAAFRTEFKDRELVPAGSDVSNRLFWMLRKARSISEDRVIRIKNVFLVIMEKGSNIRPISVPKGFVLLKMFYEPLDEARFFPMDGRP